MGGEAEPRSIRYAGCAGVEMKRGVRSQESGVRSRSGGGQTPDRCSVFIALGSNLGDSQQNVLRAMEELEQFSESPLLRSSLWESTPVDCPPGSPRFINAVVGLVPRPRETPESLLPKLQEIE